MELSRALLSALARRGVREIVLCAGARNASLVTVLGGAEGVVTYSFFEERSAAFFALGRIAAEERPVAVVTTSGTAVAECLPAVIEADYQRLPLVIVSADRPRRYRGSGAPQTITQPGLFSTYVGSTIDVEGEFDPGVLAGWDGRRPLHVNVCFDEPLLDQVNTPWSWPAAAESLASRRAVEAVQIESREPLIVVGPLTKAEAAGVKPRLLAWGRPLLLEGPSQLRGDAELAGLELRGGDPAAVAHDGIVRVGGVPTLRFWRDLERTGLPVIHFGRVELPGLPGPGFVHPLSEMGGLTFAASPPDLARDRARATRLEALLESHPESECAWVRRLSLAIPPDAHLFLGNSLPIREWDLTAARSCRARVFANRGANGIDGLISTFAGVAHAEKSNWALLGDLSTLYDLAGPWALRARSVRDWNLVVINNGGGRIFERLFKNPLFENRHDLEFGCWARQWGLGHQRLTKTSDVLTPGGRPRVIEIVPDEEQTAAFWRAWELK